MQRWLIACTRARIRRETIYIFMRALSAGLSLADQMNPKLSIYESFRHFFRRGREMHRYITDRNGARARILRGGHVSYRNFCASEFCVWMFNGGFWTLLFTMATDLIKQRARRAFRAADIELKHAFARLHRATCIFWSRVSCFLTELRVILNLYFRCIDSADW